MRRAVRSARELCRRLELPSELADAAQAGAEQFAVFVPEPFLRRMAIGDPSDPLLRQVLPEGAEAVLAKPASGYSLDPVGDLAAQTAPRLLQKYAGRALIIATSVCAVHCRYCFRRHYPYEANAPGRPAWEPAVRQIASDPSVTEVILSGGDPLTLVDESLEKLTDALAAIRHVRRLRVHSRLPIIIPARINVRLLHWLSDGPWAPVMVVHANHANELDEGVAAACDRMRRAGVTLLNQAVLLRGINDSVEAQCALSERLIEIGVVPYYLHQLDRVVGAAHFETDIMEGRALIQAMREHLPGYAVPRYVQEIAGAPSKVTL